MHDARAFSVIIVSGSSAMMLALLSNRLTQRIRLPAPLFFLTAAAVASQFSDKLATIPISTVQRIVTVALVAILFDGGMQIGRRRFRDVAGPVLALGVAGTFLTAAAVAVLAHALFHFAWLASTLLGTAVAPTDPAVVFSVLGQHEVAGRSGVLLEAESGANDPVGIALMASLLAASGSSAGGIAVSTMTEFIVEMLGGAAAGVVLGRVLLFTMRRIALPSEGLYPLRTLAASLFIYGIATLAHGSGFLAVLIAGVVIGDERAPYKGEITRFHSSLASLGETAAFIVLGFTVDLNGLNKGHAWLIGLALGALLAFVVRPLIVGPMLRAVNMANGERALVAWAGLKGAVPILLGTDIVAAHLTDGRRLYNVIVVVVVFSVVVQGTLLPTVARRAKVPMRAISPEPWSLGVRLRQEPENVRRYRVAGGSPADNSSIGELALDEGSWVSLVIRGGALLPADAKTRLRAGDEVVLLLDQDGSGDPQVVFSASGR